jgi:hypothetical protein
MVVFVLIVCLPCVFSGLKRGSTLQSSGHHQIQTCFAPAICTAFAPNHVQVKKTFFSNQRIAGIAEDAGM